MNNKQSSLFVPQKEGWYWVQTKDPLQTEWSTPYIQWIDQDVLDFQLEVGWNKQRINVISRVEEPTEGVK